MEKNNIGLKIGDSVVVKKGVLDPDSGIGIGGWQGRVSEITEGEEGNVLICIEWDSITVKNMPASSIEHCEEEGLNWTRIYLYLKEVEPTKSRDTKEDVARAVDEVSKNYAWVYLGEEGKRIQKVLAGVDEDDEMEAFEAWERHLGENLTFPFEAEVSEFQDRGPLQAGDRVIVKGVSALDDLYGVIVELRRGRERYDFPLCDLDVIDKNSSNYQTVKDYAVWFANR